MIELSELRIGNLVKDEGSHLLKVNSLISDSEEGASLIATYVHSEGSVILEPKNIFGIRLAEAWLMKLGFKKERTNDYSWKLFPSFAVQIIAEIHDGILLVSFWTRTIHNDFTPIFPEKPFEYVHQIQNLSFALSGVELVGITELRELL